MLKSKMFYYHLSKQFSYKNHKYKILLKSLLAIHLLMLYILYLLRLSFHVELQHTRNLYHHYNSSEEKHRQLYSL